MWKAFAAVFAMALTNCANGQNVWDSWETCQTTLTETSEEEQTQLRFSTNARRLQQQNWSDLREAHQIVLINTTTGKLQVNHQATVWDKLLSIQKEVHVIVVQGDRRSGSSTVASMLACAMNSGDDATTIFPAQKTGTASAGERPSTMGLWASDPFEYSYNGGPSKTYVIADVQNDDHNVRHYPELSLKIQNDAAVKLRAMLSEVASEFIYVTATPEASLGASLLDKIGLATKTMRENLVVTGEDFQTDSDRELSIQSTDHPGFIVVTRETDSVDSLDAQGVFTEGPWETKTLARARLEGYDHQILTMNFKNHSILDGTEETSFLVHPEFEMNYKGRDSTTGSELFEWEAADRPYGLEKGASCQVWKAMAKDEYKCKQSVISPRFQPSRPFVYKVLAEGLAKEIYEHAPNRQVSWQMNGQTQDVEDLTGARLKGFLEASVEEINLAGPVRDNALWRLIMEDRCAVEFRNLIQNEYGRQINTFNEALAMIRSQLPSDSDEELGEWTPENIATTNASWMGQWKSLIDRHETLENSFFNGEALLTTVREECTAEGDALKTELNLRALRIFADMGALGEKQRAKTLEQEVTRLNKLVDDQWWQINLPYVIGFGLIGIIALFYLTTMFGQVCSTCRSCAACCEDLKTADHTQVVVHKHVGPGGVELQGVAVATTSAPQIPGIAMASGSGDAALNQRIEELESVVMQLAQKVPKKDLAAMDLKV